MGTLVVSIIGALIWLKAFVSEWNLSTKMIWRYRMYISTWSFVQEKQIRLRDQSVSMEIVSSKQTFASGLIISLTSQGPTVSVRTESDWCMVKPFLRLPWKRGIPVGFVSTQWRNSRDRTAIEQHILVWRTFKSNDEWTNGVLHSMLWQRVGGQWRSMH